MLLKIKRLIAKILVNDYIGKYIALLFSNKIPFYKLKIDISNSIIRKRIAASLYFKTYESAEVRFISKYLQNFEGNIIEFGASIGVVSCTIAINNPKSKLFSFEADSRFIKIIENNFKINNVNNAKAFNEIIGTNGFNFIPGKDNTMGKISKGDNVKNNMISLPLIVEKHNISDFILVSDIEGAEYFVLNEDASIFKNCQMLIMELHPIEIDGKFITVEDLKISIQNLGYTILEQYGANIVAKK
jgi:FkbM family methyltransferase